MILRSPFPPLLLRMRLSLTQTLPGLLRRVALPVLSPPIRHHRPLLLRRLLHALPTFVALLPTLLDPTPRDGNQLPTPGNVLHTFHNSHDMRPLVRPVVKMVTQWRDVTVLL